MNPGIRIERTRGTGDKKLATWEANDFFFLSVLPLPFCRLFQNVGAWRGSERLTRAKV